jgi:hypothetical protein
MNERTMVHYRQIGGTQLPLKRPAWSFFISEESTGSESVFHYQLTRHSSDLKSEYVGSGRGLRSLAQARKLLAQSAWLARRLSN